MSRFLKKSIEIVFQGVVHLWGGLRDRVRSVASVTSGASEASEDPSQAPVNARMPLNSRRLVTVASIAVLLIAGALLFRYMQSAPDGKNSTEPIRSSSHSSWLARYNEMLMAAHQGRAGSEIATLANSAPNDPVFQVLAERLRATAKFRTNLNVTEMTAWPLKIDWSGQEPAAVDALAWSLREAIEQALDAGNWREAEKVVAGIDHSGLLASQKLSQAAVIAIRVASGRAWQEQATDTQKRNTEQLVAWVKSMKDQPLTHGILDTNTYLAELEIAAGRYGPARERLAALNKGAVPEVGDVKSASTYQEPQLVARLADALLQVGEFQQARKVLEPYTAIDAAEQNCYPAVDVNLVAAEIAIEEAEFVKAEAYFQIVKDCFGKLQHPGYFKEARMQNGLGILYTQMGRPEEAASALNVVSQIWGKALPPGHQWMGSLHNNLGALQRVQGHFDEARIEYDAAAELWRKSLGEEHPKMASYYNNIAELGMLTKQLDEVKDALNSGLRLRRDAFGDEHPWTALIVSNMGEYLTMIGQYDAALDNHRIALRIREKSLGKNHADTAMSLNNLGAALYAGQEYRQSLDHFTRAVAINKALYGEKHPQTQLTMLNLAVNSMALGDYPSAEMWLKQIVESKDNDEPPSPLQITAHAKLGDALVAQNNLAAAQVQYERVLDFASAGDRVAFKAIGVAAYSGLSKIYRRQGNLAAERAMTQKYPWAKS